MTVITTRTPADDDGGFAETARSRGRMGDVARIAALGTLSAVLITFAASMRGWPFPTLTASPWIFQLSGSAALRYLFVALFYAGVVGICWSWVLLLSRARAGTMSVRSCFAVFACWSAALFVAPPLFSGDVYVYFVDGEALLRGFSPYDAGVSAMGPAAVVHMVHPLWRSTSSMYGPIFMRMAEGIALATGGGLIAGVLLFKAVAVASVALIGASAVSIARRFDLNAPAGFVFAVLNPLTMLHLVGGAHNDATMVGLMFAGLAVGVGARTWPLRLVAVSLCTAGAAFKLPAFAAVLVLGWIWAGPAAGLVRRATGSVLAGAASAAVFAVITVVCGLGVGWVNALDVPGLAEPVLAPANAIAKSFGALFGMTAPVKEIARTLTMLVAMAVGAGLVLRTRRHGTPVHVLRAAGWALLLVAWSSPAVYPWYLTWGVALVGAVGAGAQHRLLVGVVLAITFVVTPGGYGVLDSPSGVFRTLTAFATVAAMLWAIRVALRNSGARPVRFLRRGWADRKNLTLRGLARSF